jgi:hypothetical protein
MPVDEQEIHISDIGTVFEVTVVERNPITCLNEAVDISSATLREMRFKKPSLAVVVQTAVFTTDGTDGKIQYVSVADDLDQSGDWKLQGYVEMPLWQGYTSIGQFEVAPNL